MSWKTIAFLILLVLLSIFTFQNYILINIKFLHWEIIDVPLVVVLLSGLVFGFMLASIMQLPRIMKLKRELKRVVRELEDSEKIVADNDEDVNSEGISMGSDYQGGFFNDK
ncbi:MAG TPA: lipopolysaccharide assembly protein LapA domain-containing protein [Prolixibacteraceae bacterium]|nr:lipopolysaccharide assembly protein LapA domain-containing protein [Prolixibacteraceae bacterium]